MQIGMPRECRPCDLPRRILIALLREAGSTSSRIPLWQDRSMGATGVAVRSNRQLYQSLPLRAVCIEQNSQVGSATAASTIRGYQFSALGSKSPVCRDEAEFKTIIQHK